MRQITFELLRHGPPNNQLLSPLTPYLALCENHAAVTVQVPFEHNQFLHRLNALSYKLGDESRAFQVKDTARVLGELLGQVPGLIAELSRDGAGTSTPDGRSDTQEAPPLTHLRLIISASELALLPFEMALTPNGFPGAGQSLLLQSQDPICLTREVRRVPQRYLHWPKKPRVLFVAAAPPGVGPIPMDSHLAILRRIVEPWVQYADTEEERRQRMDEQLVVLPQASCQDIERACAEGEFSHVHILAHGVQYQDGFDVRFGLALHDPRDPGTTDIVSGERLATILRAVRPGRQGLSRPVAVTLASCDSGNVGTVAGTGASVAHALHAAEIPMVVASQFPLSFAGSILFVDVLYSGLLWGEDPRVSLNDLRRRLHSRFSATHDWASVSGYLSLPPDFDRRRADIQIDQTMRSIEAAMNFADRATAKLIRRRSPGPQGDQGGDDAEKTKLLEDARGRIEAGRARMEALLERSGDQKARVMDLPAVTEKRCAEVYFSFSRIATLPAKPRAHARMAPAAPEGPPALLEGVRARTGQQLGHRSVPIPRLRVAQLEHRGPRPIGSSRSPITTAPRRCGTWRTC